jgi:hypothetical protein
MSFNEVKIKRIKHKMNEMICTRSWGIAKNIKYDYEGKRNYKKNE